VAIQRRHEILQAPFIVRAPLGLIGGGAIGNILDRVQLGYVPDFIRVPRIGLFQVFNVSDAAIVVGTGVLVVALWFIEQRAPKKLAEAPAPTEETPSPPGLR
jgi:signal peptidase II